MWREEATGCMGGEWVAWCSVLLQSEWPTDHSVWLEAGTSDGPEQLEQECDTPPRMYVTHTWTWLREYAHT